MLNFRKQADIFKDNERAIWDIVNGKVEAAPEVVKAAVDLLYKNLIKLMHGAVVKYAPGMNPDQREEFVSSQWEKFLSYSLPNYDPLKSKLSTFVYTHMQNMLKNYFAQQARSPEQVSLDDPVGEDQKNTGMDLLVDPSAADFPGQLEVNQLLSEIKKGLPPTYQKILDLWIETGGDRDLTAELLAKETGVTLSPQRMYRVIRDIIRPAILQASPQAADYVRSFEKASPAPPPVPEEVSEETSEEPEYVSPYDQPAPLYRIDPETGEKTRIGLNFRKRVFSAVDDAWFNVMTLWMHSILHGN